MKHEERVARLRTMLTQVAGPDGLESMVEAKPAGGFESAEALGPADVEGDKARATIQKLEMGAEISPDEAFGLEAIILPKERPVVYIRKNKFDPLKMKIWTHLNAADVRGRIEPLFPSIGRIELPLAPTIPYGGTGFVVGPNLLMTNRHVARLFAEGLGTRLTYHSGGSAVDFNREYKMPEPDTAALVRVERVVMIHPYWDMAILKVTGLPASAKPLKLSTKAPDDLVGDDVVAVGYPAQDYRNDLAVQDKIFEKTYGVKRLQPGKAQRRERIASFENTVDAMTHDCSTLGGNSGSAVIDVASGSVVGLHFAGVYLKANYAVPTFELARDSRVVDAGLNFQGAVAPTTTCDKAWARSDGGHEQPQDDQRASDDQQSPQASAPARAGSGTATVMIPLYVTVAVGAPAAGSAHGVVVASAAAGGEAEVEKVPVIFPGIEKRDGYREEFLELPGKGVVPMPDLTPAGKAIAATLEDGSQVLNYHRFSVVVHKKRRLALFTAANVDWRAAKRNVGGKKPSRKELDGFTGSEREDWVTDSRIPFDHQLPDFFYTKDAGAFDKGHLVRRDDVAWGDSFKDMQKGNGDTFHTTNCSPQTADFNRAKPSDFNWGALENMVQQETKAEKVCVFSGPVLADDDRFFHGKVKSGVDVSIQIPSRFWKIIVAKNGNKPAAFGFVLDQDLSDVDLFAELIVPKAWKKFMKPISEIEGFLSGLAKLTWLKKHDQFE